MGLFFAYIIKSSVCLAVFYLFHRILLSKDTFHRFNRMALISVILFSVVIPFIGVSTASVESVPFVSVNPEQLALLVDQPVQESTRTYGVHILILLYIAGILFFMGRLFYSCCSIIHIIRTGEKIRLKENITLIVIHQDIVPFSWMRYVVISKADQEKGRAGIIEHEMGHIKCRHSWDILVSELYTVFHWFNPMAWFLKQELQDIHEYEADKSVINQGIDAKRYQLLLIEKAVGSQRFNSMTNSFNHSKLKKRITMMLKSKSNAWARLKYMYVFPLAAISVAAFARPEISGELENISSAKFNEIPFIRETFTDKSESFSSGENEPQDFQEISESVEALIQKYRDEIESSLHIEQAKIDEAVQKALAEIKLLNEDKINEQIERALKESEKIMDSLMEEHSQSLSASLAATGWLAIFIDDKRVGQKEFDELKQDNIQSISIDMNRENASKHGEEVMGVITIQTRRK